MKIIITLIIALLSLVSITQAQQSGLKLLEVNPSASDLARAEASVATPNGAASIHSNPALLALNYNSTIDLSYTSWISESNNIFGGINLRNGKRAIAFSFYTSGVTGLEQRDSPGESNGDFSIQYLSISGAYAYDFNYFTAGISGHYLNEEVFPFRATGYGVNLGLASSLLQDRIRIGASILNMGEMEELNEVATELPSSFNLGFSVDLIEFTHKKSQDLPILITLMADYVRPTENSGSSNYTDFNPDVSYFNFGIGFEIAKAIQINAGYKTGDNTRPISFGAGFITEKVIFNYALIPFNTGFGTVHSIGIQYQL